MLCCAMILCANENLGGEKMPNIKSAIKRVKTTKAKSAQNKTKKSELKTTLRTYRESIASAEPTTQELLQDTIRKVDQAATKKLIHRNAASRKKAQLMKAFKAANQ